jgi:hypothetical protein
VKFCDVPGTVDVDGTELVRYVLQSAERCFLKRSAGVGELAISCKTVVILVYQHLANFRQCFLAAFGGAFKREVDEGLPKDVGFRDLFRGQQHAATITHEDLRRRPFLIEIENEDLEAPEDVPHGGIDGVDIFEDEDKKTTVRDLVRAAASVPNFAVVVTARNDFGKDEPSWLPKEALDALGRAPAVLIDSLNADEIDQLSEADPSLAFLLADKHPAREVTRNLFRLARLVGRTAESPVPVSEAAMAQQWWTTGDGGETGRRERTRLLRRLAEQSLKSFGPFDTRSEDAEALQSLIKSATLRELKPEQVVFHHDVLHDWALGCLLHDEPVLIDQLPLNGPAPETLVRGVEIAARLAIETSADDAHWASLLDRLSQTGIHGSWRRAVLIALVRSEVGLPVLDRASQSLLANKGQLLKELLRVTYAVDSESGIKAYSSIGIELPSLPTDFFIPAAPSWLRLVLWTHTRIKEIPNEVIPDLVDFYSRWSMAMLGQDPITPHLLAHFHEWLAEVESALHPEHLSVEHHLRVLD